MLRSILNKILSNLQCLLSYWKRDIARRQSLLGKIASIVIGLFIICCAFSLIASLFRGAGEALGIIPTRTPLTLSTSVGSKLTDSTLASADTSNTTIAATTTSTLSPTSQPLATSTPKPSSTPTPKEELAITASIVRLGKFDIAESLHRKFSFDTYGESALTTIDKTIDDYQEGSLITAPFRENAEVEIRFSSLTLKSEGLFSKGSYFEIIPDPKEERFSRPVMLGKIRSWKIESGRAIALIDPWIHVPYGDGGVMKLMLYLETTSGTKFTREWVFQVEKNIR